MELAAWGMFRARAIIRDKACSAVVMVLPPGVFMTTMPRLRGRRDVHVVQAGAGPAHHL